MKTNLSTSFFAVLVAAFMIAGCGKDKVAPVSERIAKIWTATKVDQSSTTVYTKGGASNAVPGYVNFRLNLTSPTTVQYTEFDGNTFTGTWSVPTDTRLVLTGLTPQPTGTGGTIEFTITTLTDNQLVLARTTASQKTGGTTNTYTLSNP